MILDYDLTHLQFVWSFPKQVGVIRDWISQVLPRSSIAATTADPCLAQLNVLQETSPEGLKDLY